MCLLRARNNKNLSMMSKMVLIKVTFTNSSLERTEMRSEFTNHLQVRILRKISKNTLENYLKSFMNSMKR